MFNKSHFRLFLFFILLFLVNNLIHSPLPPHTISFILAFICCCTEKMDLYCFIKSENWYLLLSCFRYTLCIDCFFFSERLTFCFTQQLHLNTRPTNDWFEILFDGFRTLFVIHEVVFFNQYLLIWILLNSLLKILFKCIFFTLKINNRSLGILWVLSCYLY